MSWNSVTSPSSWSSLRSASVSTAWRAEKQRTYPTSAPVQRASTNAVSGCGGASAVTRCSQHRNTYWRSSNTAACAASSPASAPSNLRTVLGAAPPLVIPMTLVVPSARRRVDLRRTLAAQPEDLDGVREVGEAVPLRDGLRPRLDRGSLDLDGRAAPPAHQVVVVLGARAPPVDGLARVGAEHVDLAAVGQRLQGAVHGGEADAVAAAAQLLVDLLGGAEVVDRVDEIVHALAARQQLQHDRDAHRGGERPQEVTRRGQRCGRSGGAGGGGHDCHCTEPCCSYAGSNPPIPPRSPTGPDGRSRCSPPRPAASVASWAARSTSRSAGCSPPASPRSTPTA